VVTLYITKWVIARGIIVGKGEPRQVGSRVRRKVYYVELRGSRNSLPYMTLGSEVFLTLEEAKMNAEERFQRHLKDCQDALEAAREGFILMNRGQLQVHKDPEDLQGVHAFGRPLLPRES